MFAEFLSLTAHHKQVFGMRIRPAGATDFEVLIWIGPDSGERIEWYDRFPNSTERAHAIDTVAATALEHCRAHNDWPTSLAS
jgi:hypothetical protein